MNHDLEIYPSGTVMPKGWLLHQLKLEMKRGLIAKFDSIDDTVSQNLFADNKRDHGYIPPYHKTGAAKDWWSGEHEGYWKDAFIRSSFYSGELEFIEKSKKMVNEILSESEKNDGYIGIYSKESRFNYKPNLDNGELWSQSRILLALIAYYDFTQDEKVLDAVKKSVQFTMDNFSKYENYYDLGRGGGIAHGLMFADVCEELYNRTGNEMFFKFVEKIYDKFSQSTNNAPRYLDMQKNKVINKKRFYGHGVHTTEHLRVIFFLHKHKPTKETEELYLKSMKKLKYQSTPTGTLVCDEQVKGRKGKSKYPYEYCSIVEQFTSLQSAVAKWSEESIIEWAEKIYFNPAYGNRLYDYSAVTYLATDDRFHTREGHAERFLYSARHSAAACCVLNGGRITPIYIRGMWMKNKADGLPVALFYGPSELNIDFNGVNIKILQETDFPFSDSMKFELLTDAPKDFAYYIRIPSWSKNNSIKIINGSYEILDGFWKIIPEVGKRTIFNVDLSPNIEEIILSRSQKCIKRGPLFYVFPIPTQIEPVRELNNSGFYTYHTISSKTDLKTTKKLKLIDNDHLNIA